MDPTWQPDSDSPAPKRRRVGMNTAASWQPNFQPYNQPNQTVAPIGVSVASQGALASQISSYRQHYKSHMQGLMQEIPCSEIQFESSYLYPSTASGITHHPAPQPQEVQPSIEPLAADPHAPFSYSGVLLQHIDPTWVPLKSSFESLNAPNLIDAHGDTPIQYSDETTRFVSTEIGWQNNDIVCFGTIPDISARCDWSNSSDESPSFEVQIESSDRFKIKNYPQIQGRILTTHAQIVQGILDEESLQLYGLCNFETGPASKRPSQGCTPIPCTLEITLYGPLEILDEVGSWFEEHEIFLQDPPVCNLDVKYCNPQRLSSDNLDSCPMVSEVITRKSGLLGLQIISEQPDLLDSLNSITDLEEAPQPRMIRTILQRHQKQALTFMLRRENGLVFDGKQSNIWETVDTDAGRFFLNRVSNTDQSEEPLQFYGGIIADPMGLGKTLTMIALVATDLEGVNSSATHVNMDEEQEHSVAATLIIVPPPLLGTWEEELEKHVYPGGLKYRRHHGKFKLTQVEDVDDLKVVLTTYHTVSGDWKARTTSNTSPLFSVHWRRIILDEAHFIRNGKSQITQGVCALSAVSRWAVTGTPIQNYLSDLATLLKFVRAHPYDDPERFDADISQLWKSGEEEEAVRRVKRISAALLLRRAKGTIQLPPRQDLKYPVQFTRAERSLYDKFRDQAIMRIDEALHQDSEQSRSGAFANILQQIESLRLFCNLGLHYHTRHDKSIVKSSQSSPSWGSIAQHTFDTRREMGPIACVQCSSEVGLADGLLDDLATKKSLQFSQCLQLICSECSHKLSRAGRAMACGHGPPCPIAPVSLSNSTFEEDADGSTLPIPTQSIALPSKVEALISDLKSLPPDVKCVVFSTWRLTLDIVEAGLNQAGFTSIRFDGKVPQKERQSVVSRFRNDPSVRIMLLTLSCGAAGLTLTVASRAYLMEPHWNPSIEEQALARIHRLGQTRDVKTIRFFMLESVEERVMKVQDSKKHLVSVLFSGHEGGQTDESLGGLQMLRSLL